MSRRNTRHAEGKRHRSRSRSLDASQKALHSTVVNGRNATCLSSVLTVSSQAALALGVGLALTPATQAATFNVTNLNDNGAGSLRQAIADANGAAGADTITFQPGVTGTIGLTTGQLSITDSVSIQGPGSAVLAVSGNNASRVFYLYNNATTLNVTISGLTVTGGNAGIGGGIVDFDENLTLDAVTISGNNATGDGAGLWADGFSMNLTIRNCEISGNTSGDDGGGIYVEDTGGPLLIQNTRIMNNHATGSGGGIYLYDPDNDVTIEDCTISGNTAGAQGGGIYLYSPDAGEFTIRRTTLSGNSAVDGGGLFLYSPDHLGVIENCTISGNQASGKGGGIYLYNLYNFGIRNTTITGNSAGSGGGIFVEASGLDIENSIIANNTVRDLANGVAGSFNLRYSLVEDPTGATINNVAGNKLNQDPQLGPLGNNGGLTQTHLPARTSPVVNAGNAGFAAPPNTDQRGLPRVANARIDMGSVELVGGADTLRFSAATYAVNENDAVIRVTVQRVGAGVGPVSVQYQTSNGTAVAPDDYAPASGVLNWADGDTTPKTFEVLVKGDYAVESVETINLTLLGVSPAAVINLADGRNRGPNSMPGIPTLNEWGTLGLGSLLAGFTLYLMRRRRKGLASLVLTISLVGAGAAYGGPKDRRAQAKETRAVTVIQVERMGEQVRLELSDGTSLEFPSSTLDVARRGRGNRRTAGAGLAGGENPRAGELRAGDAVLLKIRRHTDGSVRLVRAQVFDNLEKAAAQCDREVKETKAKKTSRREKQ